MINFGEDLTAQDLEELAESWITPELAIAAGLRRVDSLTGGAIVGRNGSGNYSGMIFPYYRPAESNVRANRLRRDHPDLELQPDGAIKEKAKYLSAPGQRSMLYFSPNTNPNWLDDVSLPVIIVEGEKKALALSRLALFESEQPRFLAVGVAGVWGWRGIVGKTSGPTGERLDVKGPSPDLDRIAWTRRTAIILFDANAATNSNVGDARRALTAEVHRRGARPLWSEISNDSGINGIDDYLGKYGAEAALAIIGAAREPDGSVSVVATEWPDPSPLPEGLVPVPVLPEALLPDSLRPWLADIAERLQVPPEFPATASMVALSSVIGNQVRIRPKRRDEWAVTPNLWGAIIGRPGVMKSPAIAEAMKPLNRLEQQSHIARVEIMKQQEFVREAAQARLIALREQMKKAAKGGQDLDGFRDQFCEEEESVTRPRRFIVNDTTVEKYGELLNENPRGLLIFRDELTGFLRSLDDERRCNDRAFYLEAWNGDGSYTYDRIGRGTLRIESTTTSILGGIQPGPLECYLRNALGYGDGDDGLMQRFQMIVYPDITPDWKNVDRWPETEAKNRAFAIYRTLSELDTTLLLAKQDDDRKPFLQFHEDAQELFDEWFGDLNRALRSGEFEHPALEAHFSKYKSLMPSLALILHLCDIADGQEAGPVSLRAAERAAAWCAFLMRHAHRIYGLGLRSTAINARTLATHLQKRDLADEFTARELYRKCWAGLETAKAVEEPLGLLEDLNWLRSVKIQTEVGRPTIHYIINPKVEGLRR